MNIFHFLHYTARVAWFTLCMHVFKHCMIWVTHLNLFVEFLISFHVPIYKTAQCFMYNDEIQCRFAFYEHPFQDVESVKYKSFLYRNSDVRIVNNLFEKKSGIGVRLRTSECTYENNEFSSQGEWISRLIVIGIRVAYKILPKR